MLKRRLLIKHSGKLKRRGQKTKIEDVRRSMIAKYRTETQWNNRRVANWTLSEDSSFPPHTHMRGRGKEA